MICVAHFEKTKKKTQYGDATLIHLNVGCESQGYQLRSSFESQHLVSMDG